MEPTRPAAPSDPSPYLLGPFAPVATEVTAAALPVHGALPRDLAGVFVRTGANPKYTPAGRYHWFDGDGMLHAVHLADGGATYRNRWVRTAGLAAETTAGGALWRGIMEPPDLANPAGPYKNTANTDVVFHAGQCLATWWQTGDAYVIALPELETRGVGARFGAGGGGVPAHPKIDPRTGELMFIHYAQVPPYLSYGVLSRAGELEHYVHVDLPGPRSQHDIAITARYTVLLDLPMYNDPVELARGRVRVRFYRDRPARFGLIPRRGAGDSVRWFEAAPCYLYHTINAWEEGDEVVLLGCRIANPLAGDKSNPMTDRPRPVIGTLQLEPVFYEWRFDTVTGRVRERPLDDVLTEFPRMDNRRLGRRSRYSYNPRLAAAPTVLFDAVIKYDHARGTSATYEYPRGWYGGEVVFAPREGAGGDSEGGESEGEDAGYLLTFAAEGETGRSELYVLDAQRLADGPVARVPIPQRVPVGYHATWVPAADLARQR